MHAIVEPTRVVFGSEFIPRSGSAPDNLIVRAGTTVLLPEDATYRYVEVGGTLRISRQVDTILRYVTLVILPGGVLDIGTEKDPNLRHVELIGRNVAIDTALDPFQWGNGLVNFGTQYRVGRQKTHWADVGSGLVAGQTVIQLRLAPEGWEVGDELQIPDSDRPVNERPRVERPVFISRINGGTVTLSKGLDFDHPAITDPEGVAHLYPCVCNLTRNIVVRSEDPAGTPTHNADIGMQTLSDVRYNRIEGCGRTGSAALNNTTQDASGTIARVGTNQVGKYADHLHHAMGHMSRRHGNVLVGHPGGKWGLVVHGTHDVVLEQNIATFFPGAGFITEDGPETRNEFRHNIATYSLGSADASHAQENVQKNRPGVEGTGFWMHGIRNRYVGNEAWNCQTGFNLFNQQQVFYPYPSKPGGEHDTPFDRAASDKATPIEMADQIVACCTLIGMDWWATEPFPCRNLVAVYNARHQAAAQNSEHVHVVLTGKLVLLGKDGTSNGMEASQGYVSSITIDGEGEGLIAGCARGISGGGGIAYSRIRGLRMQNVLDYDFEYWGHEVTIEDALNTPMPGKPPQYLKVGKGKVWNPTMPPLAGTFARGWLPNTGTRQRLKNWQRTGKDYSIFQFQQLDDVPAPPSLQAVNQERQFHCPEAGKTMGYCWETYGIAWGGESARRADTVSLPGLVNCVARPGLDSRLGPPSAAMTSPTMREPAIVQTIDGAPHTMLNMVLGGEPGEADEVLAFQVDGGAVRLAEQSRYQSYNARQVAVRETGPGTHTVAVWRRYKRTGAEMPGTRRTFSYFVASTP